MEINKGSWLYTVAYGLDENKPKEESRCIFFWKFTFMLLIAWPLVLTFTAMMITMFSVFGFFVARRFPFYATDPTTKEFMVPYEKWPTIKGYRILPIYVVFLPIVLMLANTLVLFLIPIVESSTAWMVVGGVALIVAVIAGYNRVRILEAYQLLKDYLAAKKAKVCPIIKFTHKEETTS